MKKRTNKEADVRQVAARRFREWREDWNKFLADAFGVTLDDEQKAIITAIQHGRRVSVASGTARGKDFVAACAAICFLYLTPRWNKQGELVKNTKVALTAPTDRQVKNIMMPEISRLYYRAKKRGVFLPGRLTSYDIRTDNSEWFLTGFKADENNHESWSGFHAVNTMFVVTEASGIADDTFTAIEGNLQGNSRILLVFNPNRTVGYAAKSQRQPERWQTFRLNSLTAPNVVRRENVIPGQVDYEWVKDKVDNWCEPIDESEVTEEEDDFRFDERWHRPSDAFRIKVLGKFPKAAEDILIPQQWVEAAQQRWRKFRLGAKAHCRLGVDVAGMGRDESVLCPRYGNYVPKFDVHQSAGKADHMHVAGMHTPYLYDKKAKAFIDTIGEGAGVYSRLQELGYKNVYSCKYSEGARGLHDITNQYEFVNMRAYCYWSLRDWLNPKNGFGAALPPCDKLMEEATETHWRFTSDGRILIEPKEEIKKRIKRSPDYMDALANTFYPYDYDSMSDEELLKDFL